MYTQVSPTSIGSSDIKSSRERLQMGYPHFFLLALLKKVPSKVCTCIQRILVLLHRLGLHYSLKESAILFFLFWGGGHFSFKYIPIFLNFLLSLFLFLNLHIDRTGFKKEMVSWAVVAHTFYPSAREVEAGISL